MNKRVFACYYCRKVIALANDPDNGQCYQCGREMVDLRMDSDNWMTLNPDVQQQILKNAYKREEDWQHIGSKKSNVSQKHPSYSSDIINTEKKGSRRLKTVVFIMATVIIALVAILGIILVKPELVKRENTIDEPDMSESANNSDVDRMSSDESTPRTVNDKLFAKASSLSELSNYKVLSGENDSYRFVGEDDSFWVLAKNTTEGTIYYVKTNLKGEILAENTIGTPFEDSGIIISEGVAFSENGENITDMYCTEDAEIIMIAHDSTGYSIWTKREYDTFDSHDTEYTVMNIEGEEKIKFSSSQISQEYGINWNGNGDLKYCDGAWYGLVWDRQGSGDNALLWNVETGKTWTFRGGGFSSDDFTVVDGYWLNQGTWHYQLYDLNTGNDILPSEINFTASWRYKGENIAEVQKYNGGDYTFVDLRSGAVDFYSS